MQNQIVLASATMAYLMAGSALAAASVITLQAMGVWIAPPGS
ncbi:hypothetical protein [Paracoccus sp. N5]|nr:hypothetical protein [Paracoccus sp. N5]